MLQPVAYQAGFSEPGGRTNKGQRDILAIAEPLHKPRAYDQIVRQVRPVQLGMKKYLFVIRHERSTSVVNILPFSNNEMFQLHGFKLQADETKLPFADIIQGSEILK
jgi:hypothetical protein